MEGNGSCSCQALFTHKCVYRSRMSLKSGCARYCNASVQCADGSRGNGTCMCDDGFRGSRCQFCSDPSKYGPRCDKKCLCVHGTCNNRVDSDGACLAGTCTDGSAGRFCDKQTSACGPYVQFCHIHATCEYSDGTARYHTLLGTYGMADLQNLTSSDMLATSLQGNFLHLEKVDGNITIEGASIVDGDNAATNGVIHIISKYNLANAIEAADAYTVFAPNNEAIENYVREKKVTTLEEDILRYHVVLDEKLLRNDLHQGMHRETMLGFSYLLGFFLHNDQELPKDPNTSQYFFQIQTHVIRELAGPGSFTVFAPLSSAFDKEPQIKDWDRQGQMPQILRYHVVACQQLLLENLKLTPNATSLQGEQIVISVSQDSGLLSVITDPIHTPVTLFWPTDQALQALAPEQQNFLFDQVNKDKLKEYLKFHVIRDSKVLAADLPRSAWKTLQGSELSVTCGAGSDVGELFLNGQMCRVVQRELLFDLGVAYGINCLLTDPTLGGRCDTFTTFNVSGVMQKCLYNLLPFKRNLEGCQRQCVLVIQLPRCCKGYFLPDCQACPGGPDTPCNNRGVCLQQYSATGQCQCSTGFNGTACELCWPGRFGPDCQPCSCSEHGQCDDGITGSGQCLCETGWTGRFCDTPAALPPVCTPPCSAHATCMQNNTCECHLNYEGDGITCTVVDFCKQNNGGCAKVAKCSQKGTKVSCSCPKGYQGDGHSCTEVDPCADGLNGGCHEHATCRKTGPGRRKCECKSHYVGDGLDCQPEQLPLDRCLQDNGQCHADADCTDLHFQDTTVGVFHLRSPLGQYKLTFDKAREACANESATMATYNQLSYAQKASYHLCSAGWLESGRVAYPTAYASQNCGNGVVGIVDYGPRNNKSEMWDVFCYRMKDVNCTCKAGYVGDGFSCSGNMLQVLMSFPSLTNFLTKVLAYSNSSARGQAFLKHLTDLSIRGTLFVPQNSGLGKNEVSWIPDAYTLD
ncbi:Stabilin-2 [Sciurus carolinensis]|uniref:Stabilin-2 n=1 Tax=Sciurus carolinensis TaxID=30640 RepID=A0AA41T728_SCICA|nr:Stabilin-2 [Sciurus carolinensis]